MVSSSLDMLEESLVKKIEILEKIEIENRKQKEMFANLNEVELSELDATVDAKGEYIDQLLALDEGFQALFDRVKEDVGNRKEEFADQIKRLQNLIHVIMDKSASIEAEEHRNKTLAEKYFSMEREKMSSGKKSAAAAFNYYQIMSNSKAIPPQFLDKKN